MQHFYGSTKNTGKTYPTGSDDVSVEFGTNYGVAWGGGTNKFTFTGASGKYYTISFDRNNPPGNKVKVVEHNNDRFYLLTKGNSWTFNTEDNDSKYKMTKDPNNPFLWYIMFDASDTDFLDNGTCWFHFQQFYDDENNNNASKKNDAKTGRNGDPEKPTLGTTYTNVTWGSSVGSWGIDVTSDWKYKIIFDRGNNNNENKVRVERVFEADKYTLYLTGANADEGYTTHHNLTYDSESGNFTIDYELGLLDNNNNSSAEFKIFASYLDVTDYNLCIPENWTEFPAEDVPYSSSNSGDKHSYITYIPDKTYHITVTPNSYYDVNNGTYSVTMDPFATLSVTGNNTSINGVATANGYTFTIPKEDYYDLNSTMTFQVAMTNELGATTYIANTAVSAMGSAFSYTTQSSAGNITYGVPANAADEITVTVNTVDNEITVTHGTQGNSGTTQSYYVVGTWFETGFDNTDYNERRFQMKKSSDGSCYFDIPANMNLTCQIISSTGTLYYPTTSPNYELHGANRTVSRDVL